MTWPKITTRKARKSEIKLAQSTLEEMDKYGIYDLTLFDDCQFIIDHKMISLQMVQNLKLSNIFLNRQKKE